jgi:putative transposase
VKKKRFSVEQITAVLKQAEGGILVGEVCRLAGVSVQTFYRWKKVHGGMLPGEARAEPTARRKWPAEAAGR